MAEAVEVGVGSVRGCDASNKYEARCHLTRYDGRLMGRENYYRLVKGMEGEADGNKDEVPGRAMGMNRNQLPQVVGDQTSFGGEVEA